jgi:hypothetical protein
MSHPFAGLPDQGEDAVLGKTVPSTKFGSGRPVYVLGN